jgi:hypothetical protein
MNFGDVQMNAAGLPRLHAMRTTRHSGWVWSNDGRRWKSRPMDGRGERSRSPGDILSCLQQATSTDIPAKDSAKVRLRPRGRPGLNPFSADRSHLSMEMVWIPPANPGQRLFHHHRLAGLGGPLTEPGRASGATFVEFRFLRGVFVHMLARRRPIPAASSDRSSRLMTTAGDVPYFRSARSCADGGVDGDAPEPDHNASPPSTS